MPVEITMPQLSDTMSDGTLVKWLKKEGDKIKANETIAEVETDKATMEMESSDAGTLAAVLVKEGEKVPVGAVLALLATGNETVEDVKKSAKPAAAKPAAAEAPAAKPAAAAPAVATAAKAAPAAKQAAASAPPAAPVEEGMVATLEEASYGEIHDLTDNNHGITRHRMETPHDEPADAPNGKGRLKVSPLARRIAADAGVPLDKITGTGPGGRIIQRDVINYKEQPQPAAPAAASAAPAPVAAGEKQVIPMTRMRSAIAAQLLKSKQSIPHFYETIDIDLEELSKLRERLNARLEKEKVRLSIADFITKAVAATLVKHAALNARFDPVKNEITRYGDVNLGIAVSIPDGLIVPVLRAVNRLGVRDIRERTADLVDRARKQRLRREEQTEGTFTISSLGTFGIREFSAIINPPEVAILAVGSAEKRAVVRGDAIVPRTMLTVTLSADHRVVDGAVAAEFLQTLKATLEEPGMMLL